MERLSSRKVKKHRVPKANGPWGWVYNIQGYSVQDGPGVRTTVFLKGCPLHCLWCSNPESQRKEAELFFVESLCDKSCDRCVTACPRGAIESLPQGKKKIIRSRCDACGQCVQVCPKGALEITGKLMNVEQVVAEVKKDSLLYRNSGGGVTLSGGEAMFQPEFAEALLKRCQQLMIHTCLDTCGYAKWEDFEKILPHVDLVLYDIKHMDSGKYKESTGVGNELILENARKIVDCGKKLIVRVPLVPGYNDTEDNIKALGMFAKQLGVSEIDLLPFHELGKGKYASIGKKYKMSKAKPFSKEMVDEIRATLQSIVGKHCNVEIV